MTDYVTVNRANWDERAPAHAASADYGYERFVQDPAHLSGVVRFDRPLLGEIDGLRGVHLQCHIGTDTLSLARLGARMTGLDFSPAALEIARRLAGEAGAEIDYYESDVYSAADVLGTGEFDLVYTGIGAICWLPDIARWGQVVGSLLKPGGRLFIRDMHPMLGTLDETQPLITPHYPYFEQAEPLVFDEPGTYVDTDVEFRHNRAHEWNHGLGEIVMSLLDAGLTLTRLVEHDSVPWNALPGFMTLDAATEEWRLTKDPQRLAASFTIEAVKRI
ncbi:class I SAM-dependent methyltransferase [Amycolatopsis regifaucium]|uniref:Methyltransferase n=1 Tax=Amycolatopsis regifaucium TaxID=546365 RepID=A0A154MAY8_9PSEU|nr:class I SAM-dependent methyltransferase [Amycolatopsis regifaucium]KZB81450.1 methyltransferase [Amycolatopsis regifaucium]OKA04713.1 SAM-dependent methyltransferase [Amycolatopsis regifaucium]SFH31002.1 Methyltransferase domain-containing protein [Amycolatopsis regifaucium]